MARKSAAIVFAGSGGAGAISAGIVLLRAAALSPDRLFAFLWALRGGQYSGVDDAALRVLSNDDIEQKPVP